MRRLLLVRHAHATLRAQRNKTAKDNARALTQLVRKGRFKESLWLRLLLTHRRTLKRKMLDIENQVRQTVEAFGIRLGCGFGHAEFAKRVRRFMALPCVGPIAALAFKTGVDEPHRIRRSKTVGAHFGLTPRRIRSGDSVDFEGHILHIGDGEARAAQCEAAHVFLTKGKTPSGLKAWGLKVAKRCGHKRAAVTVAHARRDHTPYVARRQRVLVRQGCSPEASDGSAGRGLVAAWVRSDNRLNGSENVMEFASRGANVWWTSGRGEHDILLAGRSLTTARQRMSECMAPRSPCRIVPPLRAGPGHVGLHGSPGTSDRITMEEWLLAGLTTIGVGENHAIKFTKRNPD